jgi:hypothetical protein
VIPSDNIIGTLKSTRIRRIEIKPPVHVFPCGTALPDQPTVKAVTSVSIVSRDDAGIVGLDRPIGREIPSRLAEVTRWNFLTKNVGERRTGIQSLNRSASIEAREQPMFSGIGRRCPAPFEEVRCLLP